MAPPSSALCSSDLIGSPRFSSPAAAFPLVSRERKKPEGCSLLCSRIGLRSSQVLQCCHQKRPAAMVRHAFEVWQKLAASRRVAPANKRGIRNQEEGGGRQMLPRPACLLLMSHFYSSHGASAPAPEGWGGGNLYAWSVGCINSRPAARTGRCGGFINTGTFPLLCISISHLSEQFGNQKRQGLGSP